MRINLPPSARIVRLALFDGRIRVCFGSIRRELAEQQDVLRTPDPHLAAVLALLRPAEAIGLIVLAHHVGHDRDHAEILKSVPHVVLNAERMERFDGRHARSRRIAEQNAVFDMTGKHAPRL